MTPDEEEGIKFLLEEYKFVTGGIRHHQTAYIQLENYTVGGLILIYGTLLGLVPKLGAGPVPVSVWWVLVAMILVSCSRCFGHYLMVRKLAEYVRRIELYAYRNGPLRGWEGSRQTGLASPPVFLIFNLLSWVGIVGLATSIAAFETLHIPIP